MHSPRCGILCNIVFSRISAAVLEAKIVLAVNRIVFLFADTGSASFNGPFLLPAYGQIL
jgi:hypothetical protein